MRLHEVQVVVPPHDPQVLKPVPPHEKQVIAGASYVTHRSLTYSLTIRLKTRTRIRQFCYAEVRQGHSLPAGR